MSAAVSTARSAEPEVSVPTRIFFIRGRLLRWGNRRTSAGPERPGSHVDRAGVQAPPQREGIRPAEVAPAPLVGAGPGARTAPAGGHPPRGGGTRPLGRGGPRWQHRAMSGQRARQPAWGTFAVSVVLCAATGVLIGLAWSIPIQPNEFGFKGYAILFSLVVGGLGVVLADRRPSNPIGWIFCALGLLAGIIAVTTEYARWALIDEAGRPPGGLLAAWLQEGGLIPLIVGLGAVGWIFPEGRFLSRGWETAEV